MHTRSEHVSIHACPFGARARSPVPFRSVCLFVRARSCVPIWKAFHFKRADRVLALFILLVHCPLGARGRLECVPFMCAHLHVPVRVCPFGVRARSCETVRSAWPFVCACSEGVPFGAGAFHWGRADSVLALFILLVQWPLGVHVHTCLFTCACL